MQREFWIKLMSGKMELFKSVRGLLNTARQASRNTGQDENLCCSFQDRMAIGLREFKGKVLLVLSGQDYTAKEFLEYAASSAAWANLLDGEKISRIDMPEADHTFSSGAQRLAVEDETVRWCKALEN